MQSDQPGPSCLSALVMAQSGASGAKMELLHPVSTAEIGLTTSSLLLRISNCFDFSLGKQTCLQKEDCMVTQIYHTRGGVAFLRLGRPPSTIQQGATQRYCVL